MGVVLDSTALIGGERLGYTVPQILAHLQSLLGDQEIVIAAMTAAELVHGVWRAKTPAIRIRREEFVEEIFARIAVRPMSLRVARIVGQIDAKARTRGRTVPIADLLIGATALELGFAVATANIRHYRLISGLHVRLVS